MSDFLNLKINLIPSEKKDLYIKVFLKKNREKNDTEILVLRSEQVFQVSILKQSFQSNLTLQ